MPLFYYEVLSLGKWSPRTTNLNRPAEDSFTRAVTEVNVTGTLDQLWVIYSPDSPRNRKEPPSAGGVPADPPPTPSPVAPSAAVAPKIETSEVVTVDPR